MSRWMERPLPRHLVDGVGFWWVEESRDLSNTLGENTPRAGSE